MTGFVYRAFPITLNNACLLYTSSAKVLNKEQDKASILGQLRKFTEQIRTQAKEKQRTREAVKDGR